MNSVLFVCKQTEYNCSVYVVVNFSILVLCSGHVMLTRLVFLINGCLMLYGSGTCDIVHIQRGNLFKIFEHTEKADRNRQIRVKIRQ